MTEPTTPYSTPYQQQPSATCLPNYKREGRSWCHKQQLQSPHSESIINRRKLAIEGRVVDPRVATPMPMYLQHSAERNSFKICTAEHPISTIPAQRSICCQPASMRQVNIPEGDPMLSSSDVPFLVPASVVRVAYKILLRTKNWYTVCFIRRAARATLDYKPMPSYSGKKLSCKGILIPGTKKIANIYLAAAICLLTVDVNRKVVILHDLMEDIGQ